MFIILKNSPTTEFKRIFFATFYHSLMWGQIFSEKAATIDLEVFDHFDMGTPS
jgi:hypothetical protein